MRTEALRVALCGGVGRPSQPISVYGAAMPKWSVRAVLRLRAESDGLHFHPAN
jgi:hypothetical protein